MDITINQNLQFLKWNYNNVMLNKQNFCYQNIACKIEMQKMPMEQFWKFQVTQFVGH